MCGRFSLDRTGSQLEARFKARLRVAMESPLYNITPSGVAACIPQEDPEGIYLFRWGLGGQAREGKGRMLINARSETVREKWPFRQLIGGHRCLVLASGYLEWKEAGKQKIPYLHRLAGKEVFAMAGLSESPPGEKAGPETSFTILTREAGPKASDYHDRMPLILTPEQERLWLDPAQDPARLLESLANNTEPDLDIFSVSSRINRCFDNDPALLKPVAANIPVQLSLF
jgi:putative SOS response-associated peptidase YedK